MPQNTFPPKFRQDILYPAILNLDEIDMSNAPIGDISLGNYFDIQFGWDYNNSVPYLTYGKHGFRISINADPGSYGLPKLRQDSRVLFEFKDSAGLVLFSDVTPLHALDNLRFMGYVWIKQDPLRTYDSVTEGYGKMTIVGTTETGNPNWRNTYNIRSELPINLDLTTTDGNQIYYNDNLSPIIFKEPNKMTSGSGAFSISSSIIPEHYDNANQLVPQKSVIHMSASNLRTFSGKVHKVNIDFWRSGSQEDWQVLGDRPLFGYSDAYEDGIHKDYAEGLNPVSAKWAHELLPQQTPSGQVTKMRFRLRFGNAYGETALNTYPFSGSSSTGNEFTLEYPAVSNHWLNLDGSGQIQPGTTQFAASTTVLLQTGNGQFNFQQGSLGVVGGVGYDSDGKPSESQEPDNPL